ncbi:hypothetical protein GGR50DRAFT_452848 [Xylaria sp. CBS 124048]|nr:hypothetical protein GGR50DRAFT_452848 [Xylaria sp. CBS 124048]
MPSATPKNLLLTGFVPTVAVPAAMHEQYGTAEEIGAKVQADHERIRNAGIDVVTFLFDPFEEKALDKFDSLLREGNYDAIGIGAGVRVHPDHVALFETMVNMCGKAAPGIPLLFNDGPGGSVATLERVFKIQIP